MYSMCSSSADKISAYYMQSVNKASFMKSLWVCVCEYAYACMRVCVCASMRVCVYACVCVCEYACMC